MDRGNISNLWMILDGLAALLITILEPTWIKLSIQHLQSSGKLQMENPIGKEVMVI